MYHIFFNHSCVSVDGHFLQSFHILVLLWTLGCIYLLNCMFHLFQMYAQEWDFWSHGKFNFKESLCSPSSTIIKAVNFYFHQQCIGVSFLHTVTDVYYLLTFLMMAILTNVRLYLIVVSVCMPLIISDVEPLLCVCWPTVLKTFSWSWTLLCQVLRIPIIISPVVLNFGK